MKLCRTLPPVYPGFSVLGPVFTDRRAEVKVKDRQVAVDTKVQNSGNKKTVVGETYKISPLIWEIKWWRDGEWIDTCSGSASNNEAHFKASLDYNSNIWIHKWIYGHIPVSSAWRYIIHCFPLFPYMQAGISLYFN